MIYVNDMNKFYKLSLYVYSIMVRVNHKKKFENRKKYTVSSIYIYI